MADNANVTQDKCPVPPAASAEQQDNEERALSVFASERNEDMTALILVLIVTFVVLLFTKWLA